MLNLKNKAASFAEKLVEKVVELLGKSKLDEKVVELMLTAAVKVLNKLAMVEVLEYLEIVAVCAYAQNGKTLPAGIFNPATTATTPISAPKPAMKPVVAQKPVTKAPVAPKMSETAPARRAFIQVDESWVGTFISFLTRFVKGEEDLNAFKTQKAMEKLVNSGIKLAEEQYKTIFAAMKKAADIGFHLIGKGISFDFFCKAPVELVDDFVFGQDREMVQILAGFNELSEGAKAPGKLVARTFVMLDAIEAIKQNNGKLDEFQANRVEALLAAVNRINFIQLAEEVESILSGSVSEQLHQVHEQAKVPNKAIAEAFGRMKAAARVQ